VAETLREFVASLGFQVDEAGQRQFTQALEGATLRAKLLGDALESMARTIASSVADVASNFEQLFYSSQRVGSSVESIRAFQYAVGQLGGTAEGANSSLEAFGRNLRVNPGMETFLQKSFGVQTSINGIARDNAQVLLDVGDKLAHMPKYLAERYREMLGIDDPTLLAIERGAQIHERYNESLKSQGAAGIDNGAAARATQFEQAWRDVWMRIGNLAEGGESKLFDALTTPMKDFARYLEQREPEIDSSLGKIATAFSTVATSWEQDFQKVNWNDTADELTKTAGALGNMATSFAKFAVEVEKDLPVLQGLIGALLGARVGGLFGPMGALVGAGVGGVAPEVLEHELNTNEPHSADTWGAIKGWWSSHAPSWLGGGGSGQAAPSTQNEQTAAMRMMDRLVKVHGWTPEAAAIAAGNAQQESSFSPGTGPNDRGGDSGMSHGLMQWNHERLAALQAFAASNGKNWWDFDTQVDFLNAEARQKVPTWPSQRGLGMAGEIGHAYEGYGDESTGTRVANSARWLKIYQSHATAAAAESAAPAVPSTSAPPALYAPSVSSANPYPALDPGSSMNWDMPRSTGSGPGGPITSTVTNNINVNSPDPGAAAAAVGLHLDRTAADVARNLQGNVQ